MGPFWFRGRFDLNPAGLPYCNLTILLHTLSLNCILGDCIKLVKLHRDAEKQILIFNCKILLIIAYTGYLHKIVLHEDYTINQCGLYKLYPSQNNLSMVKILFTSSGDILFKNFISVISFACQTVSEQDHSDTVYVIVEGNTNIDGIVRINTLLDVYSLGLCCP